MALASLVGIPVHLLSLLLLLCTYVSAIGFSTDLIHRDSPLSPSYDPSLSEYDRFQNAMERSENRIKHLKNKFYNRSRVVTPMIPGDGAYYMKMSIGIPPAELVVAADTGSDLIWTQCVPCDPCFPQNLPMYDPQHSSSYKMVLCDMDSCNSLPVHDCGPNDICQYTYDYADGSRSLGNLGVEAFTVGTINNDVPFAQELVFGCGHSNAGIFEPIANGMAGLGSGSLSLVSQLGEGGRRFSYCLSHLPDSNIKIRFGTDAVVSGDGFVATPMVAKEGLNPFYYVTLNSFTVGSHTIAYAGRKQDPEGDFDEDGNVIIDSGATLTYMPQYFIDEIVELLEKEITLPKVPDPRNKFQLCYSYDGNYVPLPTLIANFDGGDVVLQPINLFKNVARGVFCFAMLPNEDIAVLGNLAQLNFIVGFDLDARFVSFKPADCATSSNISILF